jgi:hypothetical protein
MSKLTSFETDILPLFAQRDIQAMTKPFNLASYDDVKAHSAAIFNRIRAAATTQRRRSLGTVWHHSLRQMGGGRVAAVGDLETAGMRCSHLSGEVIRI